MTGTSPLPAPRYFGLEHVTARLPSESEAWPGPERVATGPDPSDFEMTREEVARYVGGAPWVWPTHPVFFMCDVHADPDAFMSGLVASGGVRRTGRGPGDLELTDEGREGTFVIGGDCFDKGPDNLGLLRAIKRLVDTGARVEILAGNHDLRTVLGMAHAGSDDPRYAHLFVRMGRKSLTLYREVYEQYGLDDGSPSDAQEAQARARLYPGRDWFERFPDAAGGLIPPKALAKEVRRIREKIGDLARRAAAVGMTLSGLEMAATKCRELFLAPGGEFHWFFDRMKIAWRAGSFLFIHAGVDDETAALMRGGGVDGLNERFHDMFRRDLFTLYHGPIGSAFRTKYRDVDFPLTERGVEDVCHAGIHAIVHGHRSLRGGQRMMLRRGLMNFECDCSVDRNTRARTGLPGLGGAATVFRPSGVVHAVSTDHPRAKVFGVVRTRDGVTVLRDHRDAERPAHDAQAMMEHET